MKKRAGRVQLAVWISKATAGKLTELAAAVGQSKTAMLEHIILTWGTQHGPVHAPVDELAELDSDEPIPEPVRRGRAGAVPVDINAPQTLADRIRSNGARRQATVLSTGERAVEGRLRSR